MPDAVNEEVQQPLPCVLTFCRHLKECCLVPGSPCIGSICCLSPLLSREGCTTLSVNTVDLSHPA